MAKISPTARFAPGTTARVQEWLRPFCEPLPAAHELIVEEVRLRADGWFLTFKGYPDADYPDFAFEPVHVAELGEEQLPLALAAEVKRILADSRLKVPPGFEDFDFG